MVLRLNYILIGAFMLSKLAQRGKAQLVINSNVLEITCLFVPGFFHHISKRLMRSPVQRSGAVACHLPTWWQSLQVLQVPCNVITLLIIWWCHCISCDTCLYLAS